MSDVHAQQFQTVQQVAATIDALTQRLSDLRQLADFMAKSEAMAAELAAHRQVAEMAQPTIREKLSTLMDRQVAAEEPAKSAEQIRAELQAKLANGQYKITEAPAGTAPLIRFEEPDEPVPGVPGAVIRRTRKTGGDQ